MGEHPYLVDLVRAERVLREMKDRPEDDFIAPTDDAIEAASLLVKELVKHAQASPLDLPDQLPSLMPDDDGEVAVMWATSDVQVGCQVLDDGFVGDVTASRRGWPHSMHEPGTKTLSLLAALQLVVQSEWADRIATLEADNARLGRVLAVEKGQRGQAPAGWEPVGGLDGSRCQWFWVGGATLDRHVQGGTADRLPWVYSAAALWWFDLRGSPVKPAEGAQGPYDSALEAMEAAGTAWEGEHG